MGRNSVLVFLKSMVMVQLFFITLLAGVTLDINKIIWQNHSLVSRVPAVMQGMQVNLKENQAAALVRNVNVMLAGPDLWPWTDNSYFSKKLPRDMMASNIQVLASADWDDAGPEETDALPGTYELPAIVQGDEPNPLSAQDILRLRDCKVALYCTHSAETYTPDSGKARLDGKAGLITKVAEQVAASLRQQGVNAIFYDEIHDFPEYDKSYTNSRSTVKRIVKEQEQLVALFDVHRDHIPGMEEAETVKIDGKLSARILIVVGTDERKPHPDWEKNLEFANRIAEYGEQLYPGLIKGVRIKAGTYNQEYHQRALLIEIGSDLNRFDQAQYAAQLFSDILIRVLAEEKNE
ncbi:MAG TPA: stage II sporulation protein P [Syntrophomonadaceae bacterium]|nr:stage II sporulation protein P [Syntrophomonadaceae bacterium]HQA06756.1 stage II sporulation protein P [Syntrophomonadaceae bacterium]HQE22611.1 stage II sporulation protein P [Syntrophomonadaceae bacterium]